MGTTLERFAQALLCQHGALVQADPGGLSVVATPELADALGVGEYARLVFAPAAAEPGAVRVDYDSLDAMGRLVEPMGRVACARLPAPPLKPIDPDAELARAVTLQNGIVRLRACEPAHTTYLGVVVSYDVLADERTAGLLEVWANPAARSIARWPTALLERDDLADAAPPEGVPRLAAEAWRLALPAAGSLVIGRIREFTESLARRRDRDLSRLRDYYEGIDQEIRRKIGRLSATADPTAARAALQGELRRLEATRRSYQARVIELLERYRVRVRLAPLAVVAVTVSTYQLRVHLLRRSRSADAVFVWNPIDRGVEPRCCDACQRATGSAFLCDDRVHYLCAACFAPCPVCEKPYCRACEAQCPRRHEPGRS